MRTTFDMLNDVNAKHYSQTEHLADDEITPLFNMKSHHQTPYTKEIQSLESKPMCFLGIYI
jgi:hypothetical protein